jgi:hypothetical protein
MSRYHSSLLASFVSRTGLSILRANDKGVVTNVGWMSWQDVEESL